MKKIFTLLFVTLFLCKITFAQDSPLEITFKPRPSLPKDYGQLDAQGVVRLRITFDAAGKIKNVFPLNTLTEDLTNKAVEAAWNIQFKPETKNNQPVTVTKVIAYSYSWHEGWKDDSPRDEKAEAIIKRAVEKLGGQNYLQVKSQISSGNFTVIAGGQSQIPSSFVDVTVHPDKERTDFKQGGVKTVQTNTGDTGWIFDGAQKLIKIQSKSEVEDFQRGVRTSLDNLLRGGWRDKGTLTYVGKRQSIVGRRNDVVRLTYPDGFSIEYEFKDDGFPAKAIYKRKNDVGDERKEEDRYEQFVEFQGVYAPFILDHFVNDEQISRVNYLTMEFNRTIPDSVFNKPNTPKELKDLKF